MSDDEWNEILLRLKKLAIKLKTAHKIAEAIGMSETTMKKILSGKKPSFMMQMRVEDWVIQEEKKAK